MATSKGGDLLPEFFRSEAWLAWSKCEVDGVRQSGKVANAQRRIGGSVNKSLKGATKFISDAEMNSALTTLEASARAAVALEQGVPFNVETATVNRLMGASRRVLLVRLDLLMSSAKAG